MPISTSYNLLKFALSFSNSKEPTKAIIKDFIPQKPNILTDDNSTKLERVSPESVGIDSKYLESFFNEVENDHSIFMNRCLIIKDSKIIGEKVKKPYDINTWNASFSLTKTTIGLAIGFLYDDGLITLDELAYKILVPKLTTLTLNTRLITIKHLLCNTTGSKFNEAYCAVSNSWVKDFFQTGTKFKPGTSFDYNSLNTYILSAIVKIKTGKSVSEYLKEKLYDPLEIYDFKYSLSPESIEEGGWGLYITPMDMAKLGLLILNKGVYNNKQIISKEWIEEMTKTQIKVGRNGEHFNYGYQIWVKDDESTLVFNGLFDQDIVIFKNTGIIALWCSSNNDAFHSNRVHKISEKYFKDEIKENYKYVERFGESDLINDDSLIPIYDKYLKSHTYVPLEDNALSSSILPVMIQATLNTFASGIESITFKKDKGTYILSFKADNADYDLLFKVGKFTRQSINLYGNAYDIATDIVFRRDDEYTPYILMRIYFLEFASQRFIKIRFTKTKGEFKLILTENPSTDFVEKLIEIQDAKTKKFIKSATNILTPDLVEARINKILNPSFTMKKI